MVCVVGQEETSTIAPPCGICRQVLYEHAGSGLAVGLADGWTSLAELLPLAFALEH
jgi:cytidine deaminase